MQTPRTCTILLLFSDTRLCGFSSSVLGILLQEKKIYKIPVLAGIDGKAAEGH